MKNQISVFVGGAEYICTESYDCELGGAIEVKNENGKYLGQIFDLSIPDIDDEDSTLQFNEEVEAWLIDNRF